MLADGVLRFSSLENLILQGVLDLKRSIYDILYLYSQKPFLLRNISKKEWYFRPLFDTL